MLSKGSMWSIYALPSADKPCWVAWNTQILLSPTLSIRVSWGFTKSAYVMLPGENCALHQVPWWGGLLLLCHCDVSLSLFFPGGSPLLSLLSSLQPSTVSISSNLEPVIKFQGCCHGSFLFHIKEFTLRGHLSCSSEPTIITLAFQTCFKNHYSALPGGHGHGTDHMIILRSHKNI